MKNIILLSVLTIFLSIPAFSQTDKGFEEAQKAMKKEMNDYIQKSQTDFNKYVDKMDKEFSGYLRKNWTEFKLNKEIKPDTSPRPAVIPRFDPKIYKINPNQSPLEIEIKIDKVETPPPVQVPNIPVILKDDPEEAPVVQPVEEVTKPEEQVKPDETVKPEETVKPVENTPPQETVKPSDTARQQEVAKPDETVKPEEAPLPVPVETVKPTEVAVPAETVKPAEVIVPVEEVKPAETEKPMDTPAPVSDKSSFDFYGVRLSPDPDAALNGSLPAEIHNTTIADFWDRLNKTNYVHLVKWLDTKKTEMNLNDWGYYMMVKKTSEFINRDSNYSRLLTWFLMTKSGYKVKVAYTENSICFLFPSASTIYGIKYFNLDNVRFYAPDFYGNQILTYEKDFPGASRVIDMNVYNALNIGKDNAKKSFKYKYKDKDYAFTINYNRNSVELYKDFPQCDIKVNFDAAVTAVAKESMLNNFKPYVDNMKPTDAVDFLLYFVQNGFPYKDDLEQFNGKEKFFFPEEDFYYPYSDCDDRAVLFSYLVRELIGLKMLGVTYPGHIATAVHFTTDESGDFLEYKGDKYMIADPTFINAPFGVTMPDYRGVKPEIIDLENTKNQDQLIASIWEKAEAGGGKPGDNRQTYVVDEEGNIFIAGYYKGEADFGGTKLVSASNCRDAFIAKFNKHGNFEWAVKGDCEGNAMANNISFDKDNNLYVSGVFEKNISFGSIMMMANEKNDVFIAKLSHDGKVLWMNQLPLDATNKTDYIYVSSYSAKGSALKTEKFPPNQNYSSFGLSFDGSNNVYYTATYASTAGMTDKMHLSAKSDYSVINYLKDETDKQLKDNCEKTISGLFAAITLIKGNNIVLSGKIIQDAFEKYNPGFKKAAPKVYETLGKFSMMKNEQGIIVVMTEEAKPVVIDRLKISNDTRMKVSMLPNGDARIDVLNGVKVGKAIIWFPVNNVTLLKRNGNVLFDYDSDHSQKLVNVKKEMIF